MAINGHTSEWPSLLFLFCTFVTGFLEHNTRDFFAKCSPVNVFVITKDHWHSTIAPKFQKVQNRKRKVLKVPRKQTPKVHLIRQVKPIKSEQLKSKNINLYQSQKLSQGDFNPKNICTFSDHFHNQSYFLIP